MKIKVQVEGKTDVSSIEDIFTALETNKINVTKSKKLDEIEEVKNIKQRIRQEVEEMLGEKIYIEELTIFKSGTYILKGVLQK
jgi:HAMP domain-containing protein